MSAPLTVTPQLAASLQRMLSRTWQDDRARAFEEGSAQTRPATKERAPIGATSRPSLFKPRQRQRSPDHKASRERRRRLGGSSALPDTLRHFYTEGQRSVLCIIAGEVKHHGACDLPVDKIGALAGVCRTTVQTTLHEARRFGHLAIVERERLGRTGRRIGPNLTNLIRIASPEWLAWIKRGPCAHRPDRAQNPNLVSTSKNIVDDTADGGDERTNISTPPSARAVRMAAELAKIAGHDPQRLPLSWESKEPARIVDRWIKDLERVEVAAEKLPMLAMHVMQRKPDGRPPNSIRYFGPTVRRVIDECMQLRSELQNGRRRPISASPAWRS